MNRGARTPEELETLLEDAFVIRDRALFCDLFDDGAVLDAGGGLESRGGEAIGRTAAELWARERIYVGGPRRVLQARDTALVMSDAGIQVTRRGSDRAWRVAICLLTTSPTTNKEEA